MKRLVLELPDEEYEAIMREAAAKHQTPAEYLISRRPEAHIPALKSALLSEKEREAALAVMMKHAGAVASGDPYSADNARIDADLEREYNDNHEDEG